MSATQALRASIVAKITAAGFDAYDDAADVKRLPCVLVDAPVITGVATARVCNINVEVPVFVLTNGPANNAALTEQLEIVEALIPLLRPERADPGPLQVGTNVYPAYELTVHRTIKLDHEEGS